MIRHVTFMLTPSSKCYPFLAIFQMSKEYTVCLLSGSFQEQCKALDMHIGFNRLGQPGWAKLRWMPRDNSFFFWSPLLCSAHLTPTALPSRDFRSLVKCWATDQVTVCLSNSPRFPVAASVSPDAWGDTHTQTCLPLIVALQLISDLLNENDRSLLTWLCVWHSQLKCLLHLWPLVWFREAWQENFLFQF